VVKRDLQTSQLCPDISDNEAIHPSTQQIVDMATNFHQQMPDANADQSGRVEMHYCGISGLNLTNSSCVHHEHHCNLQPWAWLHTLLPLPQWL